MNSMLHEAWKAHEAARAAGGGEVMPLWSEPGRKPVCQAAAETPSAARCEWTEAVCRRSANANKCAEWLRAVGVKISSIEIDRLGALITVQFSPFLWRLFANDCAWQKRRQQGEATIYTWFAVRFGARIEWEEIQCPRS